MDKPRITKRLGRWICQTEGHYGIEDTPIHAYRMWKAHTGFKTHELCVEAAIRRSNRFHPLAYP